MGMFDEIVCDYPLPDCVPAWIKPGHGFQTKDLYCTMETYTIAADGTFSIADFTGDIDFYASNWCGSYAGFWFTPDGADMESVSYRATIVAGKLTAIVRTDYQRQAALPSEAMAIRNRHCGSVDTSAPLMGRRVFLWSGFAEAGHWATVVAESESDVCLKADSGKLELRDKRLFNGVYDSEEEAIEVRRMNDEETEREKAGYQAMLDAKAAAKTV